MEIKKCLVSLVGTNPLPIAVSTLYFRNKVSEIKLLYSETNRKVKQKSTKNFADNIETLLISKGFKGKIDTDSLSDIGNPKFIRQDVVNVFGAIAEESTEIILDYTGGTKTMSVNVYNTLKELFTDKFSSVYVDARTFKIIDDNGRGIEDLRDKIALSIDEIASLHGYKREENKEGILHYESVLNELKRIINEGKIREFLSWKNRIRDASVRNNGQYTNVIEQMRIELIPETTRELKNLANREEKLKRFIEWLDGRWFEDYVYEIMKEIKNEAGKSNTLSIDRKWKGKKEGKGTEFELDILAVRGYQLFGISCTTSDNRHVCKEKGFEIFHRVSQIGGRESRSILITGMDDGKTENLYSDLSLATGSEKDSILIIGINDWGKREIKSKLKKFILGKEV